jgi:hypothetical protein
VLFLIRIEIFPERLNVGFAFLHDAQADALLRWLQWCLIIRSSYIVVAVEIRLLVKTSVALDTQHHWLIMLYVLYLWLFEVVTKFLVCIGVVNVEDQRLSSFEELLRILVIVDLRCLSLKLDHLLILIRYLICSIGHRF